MIKFKIEIGSDWGSVSRVFRDRERLPELTFATLCKTVSFDALLQLGVQELQAPELCGQRHMYDLRLQT